MATLYHIAARADWAGAAGRNAYEPDSVRREGFIHCSTGAQHARTANRFFAGRDDLVLLLIDSERLASPLRYEEGEPGELYPHIWGPLNIDAVFDVSVYLPGAQGVFEQHDEAVGFDVWDGVTLDEVAGRAHDAMAGFDAPWAVAGGWAIDLFVGTKSRPHADLELVVRYADHGALFEHLRGWDRRLVTGHGMLAPWNGDPIEPHHQVWIRRGSNDAPAWRDFAEDPTMIDLLFEPSDGDVWICRRDERIRLPVMQMARMGTHGVPHVSPEIVLLFKAKYMRWKDERDFARALPHLDARARAWLSDALEMAYGSGHPWRARCDNKEGASAEAPT